MPCDPGTFTAAPGQGICGLCSGGKNSTVCPKAAVTMDMQLALMLLLGILFVVLSISTISRSFAFKGKAVRRARLCTRKTCVPTGISSPVLRFHPSERTATMRPHQLAVCFTWDIHLHALVLAAVLIGAQAQVTPTNSYPNTCDAVFLNSAGLQVCWKDYTTLMSWDSARTFCENQGGHLAIVEDVTQAERIASFPSYTARDALPNWLGFRGTTSSNWDWIIPSSSTYDTLSSQEKNQCTSNECCLGAYTTTGWVSYYCSGSGPNRDGYPICQFVKEPYTTDECADETHNCDANAACADTDGSFTCACNSGYSGNGVASDGWTTCSP
eukprot:2319516-Rhodomonas_salina.1